MDAHTTQTHQTHTRAHHTHSYHTQALMYSTRLHAMHTQYAHMHVFHAYMPCSGSPYTGSWVHMRHIHACCVHACTQACPTHPPTRHVSSSCTNMPIMCTHMPARTSLTAVHPGVQHTHTRVSTWGSQEFERTRVQKSSGIFKKITLHARYHSALLLKLSQTNHLDPVRC